MLQRVHDITTLDAEYRRLWRAFKGLSEEHHAFESTCNRIIEIERIREFTPQELRILRGKE